MFSSMEKTTNSQSSKAVMAMHKAEPKVVALDITRSLRDRGKDKTTDRALISYSEVTPGSTRTGRSRWM